MACTRKDEREAKQKRLLAHRAKNPNMSTSELADYFAVPLRTVKQWVSAAGLGQSRTDDRRGVEETVPAPARNVVRVDAGRPALPTGRHADGEDLFGGAVHVRGGWRDE